MVVLVDVALSVRFKVAILSQPVEPTVVYVYVPAALIDCPFHEYGRSDGQTATLVVLVDVVLSVRFNVAMLSQPLEFDKVTLYEPAAL